MKPDRPVSAAKIAALTARFFPVILVLTAVPFIVAMASGDHATGWALLPGVLIALAGSALTYRVGVPPKTTEAEDSIAVVLAFPLALLFSSWPYLVHELSFLDGLFEGMSGITGTGLTRYTDIEAQPFGLHFLRAWQQWIGGYVIVTATVALLPRGAKVASEMGQSDIADDEGPDGKEKPEPKRRALVVTAVYGALTILCILSVWSTGTSFRIALLHGLTAISTAGFSPLNDSLASLPWLTTMVLMGFALLGAAALSDYARPFRDPGSVRKLASVLLALITLSALAGGGVYGFERGAGHGVALFDAMQVGSSAQTTTGFSALTVGDLTPESKGVLIASMYVGGDVGSTAGGIKLARFFALGMGLYAVFRPRANLPDTPGDGPKGAVRLLVAWLGFSALGWLVLVAAGHPAIDALFEWSSALNNTGLSVGVSGGESPPVLTRIALILAMWFGRVEILAVLLLLKPSTWRS